MIWVTWRQARTELLLGLAALAAIAFLFLWTGRDMTSNYHGSILPSCVASHAGSDDCWASANAFLAKFDHLTSYLGWLNFLPLLLGMLFAAPAVLELESGTYRFAWTQGASRDRWLLAKLGFGVAGLTAVSGALVLLWTWWRGPFDALQGRFDANAFDFEGTVPIAYALFAFALCVAAGTLLRRTFAAVGVAFIGFLAVRLTVENKLRPHFRSPITVTWDTIADAPTAALSKFGNGDWIVHQDLVDASGRPVQFGDTVIRACMGTPISPGAGTSTKAVAGPDKAAFNACLHDHGLFNQIVYHPASRFWQFQAIETALFLGLTVGLLALTVWWVRRRIA